MSFAERIGQYMIDVYPAEVAALEDWIITQEAELIAMDINDMVAMESTGEDPNDGVKPSSFVTRIRNAFNKLRGAKKKGNEAEVKAAANEISSATQEFKEEASNESGDEEKSKKWKKAAKIIIAIAAAAALAAGAVAIGRKLKANAQNPVSSNSGNGTNDAAAAVDQAVSAVTSAEPEAVAEPPVPGTVESKRYSTEQVARDKESRGTGVSIRNEDGSSSRLLSREEKRDQNRTAKYSTPNPEGNRASRRAKGSSFQEETPGQKKARLLREQAQRMADSGQTVSKEMDRRIQNADKQNAIREASHSRHVIADHMEKRAEAARTGQAMPEAAPENSDRIKELVGQVQDHFAKMKQSGGLKVRESGSNTFYSRTKQGDQAKVYKKEINGMASAIAQLTQLGYNGDAIDLYNSLKRAQK